jgi:hypothetical protein
VMFNITEGFLRRRDGETLQFLRYSFASNGGECQEFRV